MIELEFRLTKYIWGALIITFKIYFFEISLSNQLLHQSEHTLFI